ncbi:MAG TPA: ribonuclease Z [bacterium]|jgi:ribonuclease Z|nr:ribonuclease Z [bacterium]HNT65731.1 ribonuclease Z [bacterium]
MSDRLQLVFIGTGASIPSPRRRLCCLAVERDGEWLLCDCGEGTQFHLSRNSISPGKIQHIFISHLHGDHIFGLPGLLATMQMLERSQPLTLWGPPELATYIHWLQKHELLTLGYPLVIEQLPLGAVEQRQAGPFAVTSAPLSHRIPCLGYRLQEKEKPGIFDAPKAEKLAIPFGSERKQLQNGKAIVLADGRKVEPAELVGAPRPGRSIVFCTDTRPCTAGRELAQDCDVLIHDSTFGPADKNRARQTGHSTSTEAAKLARLAGAKQLVLWHISGRYTPEEEEAMTKRAAAIFPAVLLPQDDLNLQVPRRMVQ